jgi:hypothetical protein
MSFELLCMAMIAMFFGLVVAFSGYRLFLVLLPIWGFFAGFFLGLQTVQFLLNEDFLGTVTGIVVGFVVGALFAVLSYLFYVAAVAIIGFWAGYAGTVAILGWIGLGDGDPGFLTWILGVVVGVVIAGVVLRFNLAKVAIIIITAIGGTSMIIYTMLAVFRGVLYVNLLENPVKHAIDDSFWWLIFFLVIAILGVVTQIQANQGWEVESYNRLEGEAA